jgi:signal transduction histidine kinase
MKKLGGLRKRWILNTFGVVCALGLLCVIAVIMVFSAYYYSSAESDLRMRAANTTEFFAEFTTQNYNEYYQSCINYANTFDEKNKLELQFINTDGQIVATSYGNWTLDAPTTLDISEAMELKEIRPYRGKDPATGERIIAVSSPMVYSNGEVIGVLRYVTSTRLIDRQILEVAMWAFLALLVVASAVLFSSNYYIRSILIPVAEITEKAKKISAGSYGIQIQPVYNDEIGELAQTINEMSMQINQNELMQREFISSLSHELRTPLTAINGWSETLLADDSLDADTRRGMNIISREAKRLTEMVVELLDFNRMQDGRMTLNMELSDIRGEFEDTVYMYSSRLTQENIHLHYYDNDEEIPEIPCDLKRLRQVFLNILDNAAKHGGEGGKIDASIHLEDPDVVVQIRDYGPGIPEDELPLVKRKFYKGSSKARGTGIGLAVCDEIVMMHGGELWLENAEGGGTMVTIRLPISQ